MKKTYSVVLATSLVGLGLSVFLAVKSNAEESPKAEVAQPTITIKSNVEESPKSEVAQVKSMTNVIDSKSIQEKMLNAIDNYQSIVGSYRVILTPIGVDETVEFAVQQGDNPRSHVKVKSNNANMSKESIFDGEFYWTVKNDQKQFKKNKVSKQNSATSFDKKKPRIFKNEKGEPVYVKRPDPAYSSSASDVVFPQDYGFWLTPANHKIVGEEKRLDRSVAVIEGQHEDPVIAEKHQATHFKMWVDTETGVLLKLEETNDKNEVTNSIEVLSIKFDTKVDMDDLSTFEVPTEYKEITRKIQKTENAETKKSEKE